MVTAMASALSSSPAAPRCCSLGFRVSDSRRYGYCGVVAGRTGLLSHGERRTFMVLSTGISPVKQLPSSSSSSLVLLLSPEYQLEFQQQSSFLCSGRRTSSCFTTSARRGSRHSSTSSSTSSPKKKDKALVQRDDEREVDIDEDAFEALFAQLEEDLKNDNSLSNGSDDDDDITEEDLANLEKELEEALGDVDFEELSAPKSSLLENIDSDDEEPEEVRPKLKNWQLRRLAATLKIGRRKTNIKSLAAEIGLDRAFVLELLREPPPNLLLLSASLPDNVVQQPTQIESRLVDPITPVVKATKTDPEVKAPIHAMRTRWVEQKRLKKSHVQVLEKVYYRTKRPTNAMISSIVYVTNLPSKRIVKWFEDKRIEDGIPEKRQPFHRHA